MESKIRNKELAKLAFNHRVSASTTDVAIFNYLSALGTPRALTVWLLYSNMEHDQLVELEISAHHYMDGHKFRDDYLATHFLSKANFLKLAVGKKAAAMAKFNKYEELCGRTNRRFIDISLDPLYWGSNARLLHAVRCKIENILGDFTAEEFVDEGNWGPGVTTLIKGPHVSAFNKFQCETGITHDLYSLVKPWFSMAYPLWHEHLETSVKTDEYGYFTPQRGNVIVTVPKNSKTDRVIAIEPGINSWFQHAIGKMIRKRLARVGLVLDKQSYNQHLAHKAARYGLLATVDFSSASDSISRAVVQELIPERWYKLMDAARSKVGVNGKETLWWSKFSSMGNGFTFELESLIFYAAAMAVCEYRREETYDVSVYGDDVIIPSSCFTLFSSFCDFLGFRVNYSKSFFEGYFRESCGSHYYESLDCKPVYLKERLHNVHSVYKLANSIRLAAHRIGSNTICDSRFLATWRHLFGGIPRHFRLGIPFGIGDVGFIMNFDEAHPSLPGRGFEGYLVRALVELGVTQECDGLGLLLARVRGSPEKAYKNTYTLRGRTKLRILAGRDAVLVPQWYNLGGWGKPIL